MRPPTRPFEDSRWVRSCVARGSIEYSAVTQPVPRPLIHGGTRASSVAAHSTRVFPKLTNALPSAYFKNPGTISTGRSSSGCRPSARSTLLDGDGFSEVARLIDVFAFDVGNVIRQQLQRDDVNDRREQLVDFRNPENMVGDGRSLLVAVRR